MTLRVLVVNNLAWDAEARVIARMSLVKVRFCCGKAALLTLRGQRAAVRCLYAQRGRRGRNRFARRDVGVRSTPERCRSAVMGYGPWRYVGSSNS